MTTINHIGPEMPKSVCDAMGIPYVKRQVKTRIVMRVKTFYAPSIAGLDRQIQKFYDYRKDDEGFEIVNTNYTEGFTTSTAHVQYKIAEPVE